MTRSVDEYSPLKEPDEPNGEANGEPTETIELRDLTEEVRTETLGLITDPLSNLQSSCASRKPSLSKSGATYLDSDDSDTLPPSALDPGSPFQVRSKAAHAHAYRRKLSLLQEKDPKPRLSFAARHVPDSHFCSKLFHTKRRVLHLKDYHDEARAMRDIGKFLAHPIVLFKVHHTLWEEVVEEMVMTLCEEKPGLNLDVEAVMRSIISNDADYVIPECIQGITETHQGPVTEQSFIVVIGDTNTVSETQVIMCMLEHPFNFGVGAEEIKFICVVLSPTKSKHTKSGIQVARTYATLLADDRLRHNLIHTHSPEEFAKEFELECTRIHKEHERKERFHTSSMRSKVSPVAERRSWYSWAGKDLVADFRRRGKHYLSDYTKDLQDCRSIQKIISTTLFLYFALLLPGIAFGVLNHYYTDGRIDAKNVIVSQALAGLLWALFGGQPLVVIRTTIPVAIYTKVLYLISKNWDQTGDFFYTFYGMTGLSSSVFLVLYAVTGVSKIMKYCSRSTEEIVGLFIAVAFIVDSAKYISKEFSAFYCFDFPVGANSTTSSSLALRAAGEELVQECYPVKPILALFLIFVTVYTGTQIFNFKYSTYLTADKRVVVADYAIVVAAASGTLIGSYLFREIDMGKFHVDETRAAFSLVRFRDPPATAVVSAIALGFVMSILFFMEGNISASLVNNPANKLRKGTAYHQDMLVTGLINAILSVFGLPFVHGSLPHSPLHVRALADIEEHIENGHLSEKIVYVRETRLTTLISHVMIGASAVLMVPYPLDMIPIPVLYGLFVFLAITSLGEFQMWERLVLIFTEQSLYPPLHYIRRVPQKIIHCFTLLQLLQLGVLCLVSFAGSAYLKMLFPFVLILLMPIRQRILPNLISNRHLNVLDGEH